MFGLGSYWSRTYWSLALTFPPSHPRRIHIYGEGLRSMVQVKNINSKYIHWVTNFPAIVQYILWGRQTTVRACYLWVQRLKNIGMYKCSYLEQHKHSLLLSLTLESPAVPLNTEISPHSHCLAFLSAKSGKQRLDKGNVTSLLSLLLAFSGVLTVKGIDKSVVLLLRTIYSSR